MLDQLLYCISFLKMGSQTFAISYLSEGVLKIWGAKNSNRGTHIWHRAVLFETMN